MHRDATTAGGATIQGTSYAGEILDPTGPGRDHMLWVTDDGSFSNYTSIRALVDTRMHLAAMPLESAVARLRRSRQIVFAGLGASGHVAADACHKFFRLGIPCSSLLDGPSILQFAAVLEADDTMVFVSTRGASEDVVMAARLAVERGADVIALTEPMSELADAATIVLASGSFEDTGVYTPMSSRLAHLAILDALHVSLALSLGAAASDKLQASKAAISRQFSA